MISHERIWSAIDDLAARHGLTASGLARRAGLDPTTFNKSKRVGVGGRLRWPTTESLAKVMVATGTSPQDLGRLFGVSERKGRDVPLEAPPAAGFHASGGVMAAIRAATSRRAPTLVYHVPDHGLEPLYRIGDRLLLDLDAKIDVGARVVLVDRSGGVSAGEVRGWGDEVALAIPGGEDNIVIAGADLAFAARIIWASQ